MVFNVKSKINVLLAILCLLLAVLLCGCNDDTQHSTTNITDSKEYEAGRECSFDDASDVILTLGLVGQDSVPLKIQGTNYTLDYNEQIINIIDNCIVAVGVGETTIKLNYTVADKTLTATKHVLVKSPVFCGNASILPKYIFTLDGGAKTIDIQDLNADYMFDVEYSTAGKCFSVNNLGNVTPLSCGNDWLYVRVVSGVDAEKRLIYKTLETEIIVIDPDYDINLSVLDAQDNVLLDNGDNYTLYSNPTGISYKLKLYTGVFAENIVDVVINTKTEKNLVKDDKSLLHFGSKQITDNYVYLPLTIYDAGTTQLSLSLSFVAYNLVSKCEYNDITLNVYRQTTDFELTAYSLTDYSVIADDSFSLYVFNTEFTEQANADLIYDKTLVTFKTNDYTDQVMNIECTPNAEVEVREDGFVIIPTHAQTINFRLTGSYGNYTKTFTIEVLEYLPQNVEFYSPNDIDLTLNVGDAMDITPVITPIYALATIEYVFDTDIFTINNGVLFAKSAGDATLTINVGSISKSYAIHILDNNIKIDIISETNIEGGVQLSYKVYAGNITKYTDYEQKLELYFYDTNGNLITSKDTVEYEMLSNKINIYLSPGTKCHVRLYSKTYDIFSEYYFLSNN